MSVVRLRSVGQHKQKFQKNTFRSYAPRPQLTRARPSAWRSWWPQSVAQTSKSGAPIRRCAPPATLPIPSARERKSQNSPKTHNRALSSTDPPSVPSAPHLPRSDARRARSSGALNGALACGGFDGRAHLLKPSGELLGVIPQAPEDVAEANGRSTRWRSARAAATSPPAATPRWSSGTSSASRSSRPYPGTSTRSTPSSIRPAISTWRRAALRAPCSCTRLCRASRLARCASYPTSRTPTAASPACTTPRTGGRCSRARRWTGASSCGTPGYVGWVETCRRRRARRRAGRRPSRPPRRPRRRRVRRGRATLLDVNAPGASKGVGSIALGAEARCLVAADGVVAAGAADNESCGSVRMLSSSLGAEYRRSRAAVLYRPPPSAPRGGRRARRPVAARRRRGAAAQSAAAGGGPPAPMRAARPAPFASTPASSGARSRVAGSGDGSSDR